MGMLLLGAVWVVLPGVGAPDARCSERLAVTASIVPLGDFCRRLGAQHVEVQVLIPPGASPHTFEPPPSAVAAAGRAKVFVYIGAGLEPWVARLLKSGGVQPAAVVEAVRGIPLIQEVDRHSGHPAGHDHGSKGARKEGAGATKKGHDHGAGNPHVWLDPVLAQDICRRIASALIHADPGRRGVYEANLSSYLEELEGLHQEIQRRVAAFALREYVCFHSAFIYFSNRYGLREVGVIEASPGREPTPKELQRIVSAVRKHKIRVIFAEPQLNPRVAEVIAKEAGARVLFLDPVGGNPPYGTDYLALMRHNLSVLETAMSGK
jgi:zinc transport system substrate-binding protein